MILKEQNSKEKPIFKKNSLQLSHYHRLFCRIFANTYYKFLEYMTEHYNDNKTDIRIVSVLPVTFYLIFLAELFS